MILSRRKIGLLVSYLLLAAPTAFATDENDFSLYPGDTQGCLKDAAAASKCGGDTVAAGNKCLCSNGGSFVTNAARCIGREAPAALKTVWSTMSTSCSDSNTPLVVTEDNFIGIGQRESGTPSTRTASSTAGPSSTATGSATPTSDPEEGSDQNNDDNNGGLSVGAKAGIGIGSAAGAAVLGGILAMAWNSRKSRAAHDESRQSMLLDGRGSPGGEAGIGGHHAAAPSDWRAAEKNQGRPESNMTGFVSVSDATTDGRGSWMTGSPPPQQQQFKTWGHHPDQPWPTSPPPTQPLGVVPENAGVYELSSAEAAGLPPPAHHAVEMPATPGAGGVAQYPGSSWTR